MQSVLQNYTARRHRARQSLSRYRRSSSSTDVVELRQSHGEPRYVFESTRVRSIHVQNNAQAWTYNSSSVPALDKAFTERLKAFDESILRSTRAIDSAIGEKTEALTNALEHHARGLRDTLGQQANELDETLMQGIAAVRRTSENITRQSVKAIEGLATQSELLKNISENLLARSTA